MIQQFKAYLKRDLLKKRVGPPWCRPVLEEMESRLAPSAVIYGVVQGPGLGVAGGSIVKIDPTTGVETTVWKGAAGTADGPYNNGESGLAIEPNGTIIFAGTVGSSSTLPGTTGVLQLNPAAQTPTPTLLDPDGHIFGLAVGPGGGHLRGLVRGIGSAE